MISSDRNSNIQKNQIEIVINSRSAESSDAVLPYDPNSAPDVDTSIQVIAPNYLDNSDFDFSKDGYLNNPLAGGDVGHECYNFYRQRFIKITDLTATAASTSVSSASNIFSNSYTYPMDFVLLGGDTGGAALTGTLTRVSDSAATLSVASVNSLTDGVMWFGETLAETAAKALKGSSHSLYAANEGANAVIPRWDKTNGWCEIGSDTSDRYDLACPLPINLVRGGLRFYFKVYVSLRSGAVTDEPVKISVGVFDATSSQQRFIESSNLTLTGSPVGTTGATSYQYKVIADLDDGTQIESDTLTIANGNGTLSASNYNRLTWGNATGILNFTIYRLVGGVTKRVFTITNGARDFNDYGDDEDETLAGLPSASRQRPIAYAVSPAFNPAGEDVWQWVTISLDIPQTYNTSLTTGKQWVRIAVEGTCGDERMLTVDRVMLSTSNGGWQRSARDLNKILNQNPSSLPTSTAQGGAGGCFTLDTPIMVCDRDGSNMREMPIGRVEKGMYVFSGGTKVNRVTEVKSKVSEKIIHCTLSNGAYFRCSPSQRFITSRADKSGTRIDELTYGDTILCWRGRVSPETIEEYVIVPKSEEVRTLSLKVGRTFVAAGTIAHNLKSPFDIEFLDPFEL